MQIVCGCIVFSSVTKFFFSMFIFLQFFFAVV